MHGAHLFLHEARLHSLQLQRVIRSPLLCKVLQPPHILLHLLTHSSEFPQLFQLLPQIRRLACRAIDLRLRRRHPRGAVLHQCVPLGLRPPPVLSCRFLHRQNLFFLLYQLPPQKAHHLHGIALGLLGALLQRAVLTHKQRRILAVLLTRPLANSEPHGP